MSWTLSVIGRWCQPAAPRERQAAPETEKDRLQRRQIEALLLRR
ncbi:MULTISPECIES: hypothetical protein [unclassified Enterobacter]|nr:MULTISPECIES: hypothetical protein [unclassified Enterobacter]